MKWLILFVCLLPTLYEVYGDRNGENKKGKVKDAIWLLVAVVAMGAVFSLIGYNPLKILALVIGWRILLFDYLVTWVLIRNKVINPNANWFTYTGQTAKWDILVSKISPFVRLVIRVVIFFLCLYLFVVG